MFKYLRLLIICGPRIIWSYFAFLIKYSRHPEKYPLEIRYSKFRSLTIFVCKHFHVDWKLKGAEILNSQGRACLIISNHLSDFDPLALVAISEKPISFVAKKEILKYPIVGRCLRSIEGIFIDRSDLRQEVRAIQKVQESISNNHLSYVVFAEGTRNKNPFDPVKEFKAGALRSAFKCNANIIEIAMYSTYRVFKSQSFKKYPIFITCLRQYTPQDYADYNTNSLSLVMHDEVQKEVDNLRILDTNYILKLKTKTR